MKNILITKASGEREAFSESKLRRSLQRVHAPSNLVDEIVAQIETELSEGMNTSEIYRKAFSLLRKKARPVAARYSLRSALMELGPTGRPFERFVGELLKSEGFAVEVAKIVPGVCIKHEVDVVGTKGDRHIMVECKFHNQPGLRSDVKISLYVQARFEDIERQWKKQLHHGEKFHEVWLVTNTKLTSDATDYAKCVGMHAIGWNYPATGSLEELIEQHNLHPLTCLTRLNRLQKQELLKQGLILCTDLLEERDTLQKIVGTSVRVDEIVQEVKKLLKIV
ncbi:MAG TPA: ATP cone domain-containing protein [Candidatus Paceibacterota bacterium]|nr:ATP cone domain-containing protein [Candidatus Paceibacterota bacterium]